MAQKLVWDQVGERTYETGVDHGVLYVQETDGTYPKGVAWNGLTNVNESPSGAELSPLYADNVKYLNLQSAEEFGATIECYTYPDEWKQCNGEKEIATGITIGQQTRKNFGFSYRTLIGNDVLNTNYGYKIHMIYGGTSTPSETTNQTVNDSPEASTFSYEVSTTPVPVTAITDAKPTATLVIDSTKVSKAFMQKIESILYGDTESESDPRLPLPDEVYELYSEMGENVE